MFSFDDDIDDSEYRRAGAPVGGAGFGAHGFSLRWAASVLGSPSTLYHKASLGKAGTHGVRPM